jgi:hypothetical protein
VGRRCDISRAARSVVAPLFAPRCAGNLTVQLFSTDRNMV